MYRPTTTMNANSLTLLIILVLCIPGGRLVAQKKNEKRSIGVETVVILPNMTYEATKAQATYFAKQRAIGDAFGTYVGQEYNQTILNGKLVTRAHAKTKQEGIWIKTSRIDYQDGDQRLTTEDGKTILERTITCTIEGIVRKLEPRAEIEFKVLNYPDVKAESASFTSDDYLYLYFRSPIEGYLAVFVDEGEITRRILPYSRATGEAASYFKVRGDSSYIFFNSNPGLFASDEVDPIILYTDRKEQDEINTIYVVFSERPFVKPILEPGQDRPDNTILPQWLKSSRFYEWLEDNRATEYSFQDNAVWISISPKQ